VSTLNNESTARIALAAYLSRIYQANIDKNIYELISIDNGVFADRFNYFCPKLEPLAFEKALISGCAAGSEPALDLKYGFREAVGTEVTADYVSVAKLRFEHVPELSFVQYDGASLPFPNDSFSMVISGHIIEHTPSPFDYLKEHAHF